MKLIKNKKLLVSLLSLSLTLNLTQPILQNTFNINTTRNNIAHAEEYVTISNAPYVYKFPIKIDDYKKTAEGVYNFVTTRTWNAQVYSDKQIADNVLNDLKTMPFRVLYNEDYDNPHAGDKASSIYGWYYNQSENQTFDPDPRHTVDNHNTLYFEHPSDSSGVSVHYPVHYYLQRRTPSRQGGAIYTLPNLEIDVIPAQYSTTPFQIYTSTKAYPFKIDLKVPMSVQSQITFE